MIHDTFENNPGLCELFRRKMLERARFVGFSENLIDFEARIDKKGTYQDNLRIFYREYPQLSRDSDYFRIKSIRPLSGAALEQSWRSYERNNGVTREPPERRLVAGTTLPELTITYTIGGESERVRNEAPIEPTSIKPMLSHAEANPASSTYRELVKSILDRVTAMAGEKVTKTMLHQIGQEIGRTAFHHSRSQILSDNLFQSLDDVLSVRGLGRVIGLEKTDHGSGVTYVCTIEGCPLFYKRVSTNPACGILRGFVSRWLESFVQKNAETIETACDTAGSHLCVFRVTFKK